MIKLGVFQVSTSGHGFTLAVEKTVAVTEKQTIDGKLTHVKTGETKTVIDGLGFYPKVDQVVNRIVQHELSKTNKLGGDLQLFIATINGFTDALNNLNKEVK